MKRIITIGSLAGVAVVVAVAGSCKTMGPGARLSADETSTDPLDNRSPVGGSRGSMDQTIPEGLPRFVLKSDYPETPDLRTPPPPMPAMAVLNSSTASMEEKQAAGLDWILKMQQYIYADMNDQNLTDPNQNFRLTGGAKDMAWRRWYHMPWLHTTFNYTPRTPGRGRDGVWGLTRELDLRGPLHPDGWPKVLGQTCIAQDWGLGFFNEPGGYAIGQVFPSGNAVNLERGKFPVNTVSFKILFTGTTPEQLAEVDGAWQITANINAGGGCIPRGADETRVPTTMRHVQMDVMMRHGPGVDDWIFGGFVYDKDSRDPENPNRHDPENGVFWQGMVPFGVQWGPRQNETVSVARLATAKRANKELATNGLHGRLNGPADNPMSSCLSCHARAQWPELPFGRLPFAPENEEDSRLICLLHDWGGEGTPGCPTCRGLNECIEAEQANVQGQAVDPAQPVQPAPTPAEIEATCRQRVACIPSGRSPVPATSQTMDYALQLPLALRNRNTAVATAAANPPANNAPANNNPPADNAPVGGSQR